MSDVIELPLTQMQRSNYRRITNEALRSLLDSLVKLGPRRENEFIVMPLFKDATSENSVVEDLSAAELIKKIKDEKTALLLLGGNHRHYVSNFDMVKI